ncbi:hypothetical protein ACWD6R_09685 [Streptomyces sp. NPDC005151]
MTTASAPSVRPDTASLKVVAPGYQNLRMDETHEWSWHLPRLASAAERTGCPARRDDPRDAAPHPLP